MLELVLIESDSEKIAAENLFAKNLSDAWLESEKRLVSWRPSSKELIISHNNKFWFGVVPYDAGQKIPRYWNSFGKYETKGNLQISVEINIPVGSNTALVSGFFAKDPITEEVYLMHDGGIGGGRADIGKKKFLNWSSAKPIPVLTSKRNYRFGIVVSAINSKSLGYSIERYVKSVFDFKAAMYSENDATTADMSDTKSEYSPEFFGIKKGIRKRELEYISRHGQIVHALKIWRDNKYSRGKVFKKGLIDLGVKNDNGDLIELYEVKTNTERHTIYTAIGQLLVYGTCVDRLSKFLVIPKHDFLPADIISALKELDVKILQFEMDEINVTIID